MEAESVLGRPAAALADLVHGYHGYRYTGFPAGRHIGLPGRHVTFVLSLEDPLVVSWPRGAVAATATVGGLHAGPVTITHGGTQVGVHVDVLPAAVPTLFGVAPGDLTGDVVDLASVVGAARADELEERVRAARTWAQRFAAIDLVLLRGRRAAPAPSPEVARAWDLLVRSVGAVPVAAVAAEVGWSRRHLSERFGREVGFPPKALARVVRFQAAVDLLKRDPARSLADLAAVTGYADQPHLNRDFRAFAGLSPSGWLAAEDLPLVQDDGLTAVG